METGEKQKAQRQLEWMRTNIPPMKGPTTTVMAARKRTIRRVLSKIWVSDEGCMLYLSGVQPKPAVYWPKLHEWNSALPDLRGKNQSGEWFTCQWPLGCSRPPRERSLDHGKHPKYCEERHVEVVKGVQRAVTHDSLSAHSLRPHVWKRNLEQRSLSRLLLEIFHTGVDIPRATAPWCRNSSCVHPGHRMRKPAPSAGIEALRRVNMKYSKEDIRRIALMRFEGSTLDQIRELYPDLDKCYVRDIVCGRSRASDTVDIRASHPRVVDARSPLPAAVARGVVELSLENPGMSFSAIGRALGLDRRAVARIIKGVSYAACTEDLRAKF